MNKLEKNHMHLSFDARSINEGFARMTVAAFMMDMNPTLEELTDVKTAISEAVTNSIIHGYADENMQVELICERQGQQLLITVQDSGIGISDVHQAMQPFYTSKPDMERSGMGFAFMEAFMDEVQVDSAPGEGTSVKMKKLIGAND